MPLLQKKSFYNKNCNDTVQELKLVNAYCRKGSIVSEYNLFFIDNATIVAEDLNNTLKKYLADRQCKKNGADCQLGPLVGVDMTNSDAGGIILNIIMVFANILMKINPF